ncbi:hypothetical protein [Aeromonas sp. FDAARGOS 1402]|uniref:hypothetical protein n=1 Tax=Aeromonas sp. FDAARGOS 1402 TaxID=2778051 RepID=UPI0020B301EF|nr:hypothetical protein [Aeromonas sp. FDAARGOS 1402]
MPSCAESAASWPLSWAWVCERRVCASLRASSACTHWRRALANWVIWMMDSTVTAASTALMAMPSARTPIAAPAAAVPAVVMPPAAVAVAAGRAMNWP